MHENNKIRNPHEVHDLPPTKRAEIVIRFDVADTYASQDYLDAIVGTLKRELRGYEDFAQKKAEVKGKWL